MLLLEHISRLHLLSVCHERTPLDVREQFALDTSATQAVYDRLCTADTSAVVLSTCNRVEIYLSADRSPLQIRAELLDLMGVVTALPVSEMREHIVFLHGEAVIDHVLRVSAGLKSMIIGEGQILSQLKQSYIHAREHGYTDSVLNQMFQRALCFGKRVRTETNISRGSVSTALASLELVQLALGTIPLGSLRTLVVGTGQIAHNCLHFLTKKFHCPPEQITVLHRSSSLAEQFRDVQSLPIEHLQASLAEHDLMLVCTSAPHYLIDQTHLLPATTGHAKYICDLSVPRNVDPAVREIPGVVLFDIDSLNTRISENLAMRTQDRTRIDEIFYSEKNKLVAWCQRAPV